MPSKRPTTRPKISFSALQRGDSSSESSDEDMEPAVSTRTRKRIKTESEPLTTPAMVSPTAPPKDKGQHSPPPKIAQNKRTRQPAGRRPRTVVVKGEIGSGDEQLQPLAPIKKEIEPSTTEHCEASSSTSLQPLQPASVTIPPAGPVERGLVHNVKAERRADSGVQPDQDIKEQKPFFGHAVVKLEPVVYNVDSDSGELSGASDMWRRVALDVDDSEVEECPRPSAKVKRTKAKPQAIKGKSEPRSQGAKAEVDTATTVQPTLTQSSAAASQVKQKAANASPSALPATTVNNQPLNEYQQLLREYALKRRGQDFITVQHEQCLAGLAYRGMMARYICTHSASFVPPELINEARSAMAMNAGGTQPTKGQLQQLLLWFTTTFTMPAAAVVSAAYGPPYRMPGAIPELRPCEVRLAIEKRICRAPFMACATFCTLCHAMGISARIVTRLAPDPPVPLAPSVVKVSPPPVKEEIGENAGAGTGTHTTIFPNVWCELLDASGWSAWVPYLRPQPQGAPSFHSLAPYVLAFGAESLLDVTARYTTRFSDIFLHRLDSLPMKLPLSISTLKALYGEVTVRDDDFNEAAEQLDLVTLISGYECDCSPPCPPLPVQHGNDNATSVPCPWRTTAMALPPLVNIGCGMQVTTRDWLQKLLASMGAIPAPAHELRQLQALQFGEAMPKTAKALRQSPLFITKDLLGKRQVIYQGTPLPTFIKGTPVYPRTAVYSADTREGWLSRGRNLRAGEVPVKKVAPPPSQQLRMRECCLYGVWQTEPLAPPKLIDGKLPINRYGRVELLYGLPAPEGTVHLKNMPGVQHVARKLGVEYASVVTDFEWFGGGRCAPRINGIVVHLRDEAAVREAFLKMEAEKQQQAEAKRLAIILKRWETLVKGATIRAQLMREMREDL